jgi:hypothetical protein
MGAATQYTVNNQMVNATLMNIADNPTNVQLPGMCRRASAQVWGMPDNLLLLCSAAGVCNE